MDGLTAKISSIRLDEATTPLRCPPIDDAEQKSEPSLDEEILAAIQDTTLCAMDSFPYGNQTEINAVFNLCKSKTSAAALKEKFDEEPNLLSCRYFFSSVEKGQTPLHNAAFHGNVAAIRAILECEEANAFVKDEQGRTALHIAAALVPKAGVTADDISACIALLKEAMGRTGRTPIGPDAPVDVIGLTPLGYSNRSKKSMDSLSTIVIVM